MVISRVATGRVESYFGADYTTLKPVILDAVRGARVLVIGGAGAIGRGVVGALLELAPAALHVVDINENGLVEVTRDLRASRVIPPALNIQWRCLDFGSPAMERMIRGEAPYDHVLNFAAVKHVRSEKDVFCMLHMLDVNVVRHGHFLRALVARHPSASYFSVSTDKAANPVNVMGASKRLMEHVVFSSLFRGNGRRTSARFANVAFSDGSLLHGWIHRLAKQQPLSVPADTRRYFVSLEEAAQLCVIAAFGQPTDGIAVPRLDPESDLRLLQNVARDFLRANGLEPAWYSDEQQAFDALAGAGNPKSYPVVSTALDTSGEKPFEEFVGRAESIHDLGLASIEAVRYEEDCDHDTLRDVFLTLERFVRDVTADVSQASLLHIIRRAVPGFEHIGRTARLDDRV